MKCKLKGGALNEDGIAEIVELDEGYFFEPTTTEELLKKRDNM